MTDQLDGQMTFLDLVLPSSKTLQEHSAAIKEKTFKQSSKHSATLKTPVFLFLNLRKGNGNMLGASWETVSALPGASMTLNFGECPSEEKGCSLLQTLDLNAPEKYCLSKRACSGIMRRAEERGKELPDMLKEAMMEVICSDG